MYTGNPRLTELKERIQKLNQISPDLEFTPEQMEKRRKLFNREFLIIPPAPTFAYNRSQDVQSSLPRSKTQSSKNIFTFNTDFYRKTISIHNQPNGMVNIGANNQNQVNNEMIDEQQKQLSKSESNKKMAELDAQKENKLSDSSLLIKLQPVPQANQSLPLSQNVENLGQKQSKDQINDQKAKEVLPIATNIFNINASVSPFGTTPLAPTTINSNQTGFSFNQTTSTSKNASSQPLNSLFQMNSGNSAITTSNLFSGQTNLLFGNKPKLNTETVQPNKTYILQQPPKQHLGLFSNSNSMLVGFGKQSQNSSLISKPNSTGNTGEPTKILIGGLFGNNSNTTQNSLFGARLNQPLFGSKTTEPSIIQKPANSLFGSKTTEPSTQKPANSLFGLTVPSSTPNFFSFPQTASISVPRQIPAPLFFSKNESSPFSLNEKNNLVVNNQISEQKQKSESQQQEQQQQPAQQLSNSSQNSEQQYESVDDQASNNQKEEQEKNKIDQKDTLNNKPVPPPIQQQNSLNSDKPSLFSTQIAPKQKQAVSLHPPFTFSQTNPTEITTTSNSLLAAKPSMAIGPGGKTIELLPTSNLFSNSDNKGKLFTGSSGLFGSASEKPLGTSIPVSSLFGTTTTTPSTNLFEGQSTTPNLFNSGVASMPNNLFGQTFLQKASNSGSLFGGTSLFPQTSGSLFGVQGQSKGFGESVLNRPVGGEDEEQESGEDDGPLEAEDNVDPSLSTGKYDYIQTTLLFKETAIKFRQGSKELLQNVTVSLEKFPGAAAAYIFVRLANKCVAFSGRILPKTTQIRILNSNPKNLEIKKILQCGQKVKNTEFALLRIQFKDNAIGSRLLQQVETAIAQ